MTYEYKCVAAPTDLIIKKQTDIDKSVRGFGALINSNLDGGWEFYSMEQITCTKPAGCLASIFGKYVFLPGLVYTFVPAPFLARGGSQGSTTLGDRP